MSSNIEIKNKNSNALDPAGRLFSQSTMEMSVTMDVSRQRLLRDFCELWTAIRKVTL